MTNEAIEHVKNIKEADLPQESNLSSQSDDSVMLSFQEAIKSRDFATMKSLLPRMFAMEKDLHEIYFKTLKSTSNPYSPKEIYSNILYCQKALVNVPNYDANDVWLLVMLECLKPASSIISASTNFQTEANNISELICENNKRREGDLSSCSIVNNKISALNTFYINGNIDLKDRLLQKEKKLAYFKNRMEWQNTVLNIVNVFAWLPLLLTNIKRIYFQQSPRLFRYTGERYSQLAAYSMMYILEREYFIGFKEHVKRGDLKKVQVVIEKNSEKSIIMISSLGYDDITNAFLQGNPAVFEYLCSLDKYNLIKGNPKFFIKASRNDDLDVMQRLMELALLDKVQDMIAAEHFEAFRSAAENGHSSVLERLIELLPDKVQDMVAAFDFRAFQNAAANGHLPILERLIELLPDKVQDMVAAFDFRAFQNAAANGHLPILERLMQLAPDKVQDMIAAYNFEAFRYAALNGHLPVLERLIELAPDKVQEMIAAYNFEAFQNAAEKGHLDVLERLVELAPDKVQDMIAVDNFEAFRYAALNGHLPVLERLVELAPDKVQDMIAAYNFEAFQNAAEKGHLDVLERLVELAPDKVVQEMIAADNFEAFRDAAAKGHLDVLERLIKLVPGKVQEMSAAYNFEAFQNAAAKGHLDILERLIKLAPSKVQEMIAAENFGAFRDAAAKGHLDVLERLIELAPDKVQDMIAASKFRAFRNAAENGHLDVLERLIKLAPDKVQDMIAAYNFEAFQNAAAKGHLDVLERLIELAPGKVQDMIAKYDFEAFRYVASNGHLSVLERLMELVPEDKVQAMIAARNFGAFKCAASNGNLLFLERLMEIASDKVQEMIAADNFEAFKCTFRYNKTYAKRLLNISNNLFAYAEMHEREYSDIVNPFIEEILRELHREHDLISAGDANRVFDIEDADKSKQCFYIIRNLIRRLPQNPALLDEIRFLINIPSVKSLLHTAVTPNNSNELLRLALSNQSVDAAELLLNIPAVRELAEANNYYRNEMRGGLDLGRLARDRESSMTALTFGEQKRLQSAIIHYNPTLEQTGINNIMQDLRLALRELYTKNPATIKKSNNKVIILPFDWLDFQELNLSNQERETALKEYYKNKFHTAFRYLSKPNNWMSPYAQYVNQRERCSTFEEYQPLISMLYLAAKDRTIEPIDGYTVESRVEQFIYELAYIGRAHNWDRVRERAGVEEEYDDLEGDKPSCYSGVKRRLFQAVKGHHLLKFLTLDDIKQELRAFMRQHFQKKITLDNVAYLRTDWKNLCETGELSECFKVLDVSPEEQEIFIQILQEKYKTQFTEDPVFINHITASFKTDNNFKYHIVRFAGETDFEQLLEDFEETKHRVSLQK